MKELRELADNPTVVWVLAVILVIIGLWFGGYSKGVAWILAGGCLMYISALIQDIHELKDRLTSMERDQIAPLREQIEEAEQRLQVVELFRRRVDAQLVDKALEDLPPAASAVHGWAGAGTLVDDGVDKD